MTNPTTVRMGRLRDRALKGMEKKTGLSKSALIRRGVDELEASLDAQAPSTAPTPAPSPAPAGGDGKDMKMKAAVRLHPFWSVWKQGYGDAYAEELILGHMDKPPEVAKLKELDVGSIVIRDDQLHFLASKSARPIGFQRGSEVSSPLTGQSAGKPLVRLQLLNGSGEGKGKRCDPDEVVELPGRLDSRLPAQYLAENLTTIEGRVIAKLRQGADDLLGLYRSSHKLPGRDFTKMHITKTMSGSFCGRLLAGLASHGLISYSGDPMVSSFRLTIPRGVELAKYVTVEEML